MKKLNYLFAGLAFFAIFSLSSCGSDDGSGTSETDSTITELEQKMDKIESEQPDSLNSTEEVGNELSLNTTDKYTCPNRCKGSGSDKPGECKNPECGMELMENPNFKKK